MNRIAPSPKTIGEGREQLKQMLIDASFVFIPMDGKSYKVSLREAKKITNELNISMDVLIKIGK